MTEVIRRNAQARRYELLLDGVLAVIVAYREHGDRLEFIHTETLAGFTGQGLAGKLAAYAVQDGIDRGLRLVPYCPFIAAWLQKHPEFSDSVDLLG